MDREQSEMSSQSIRRLFRSGHLNFTRPDGPFYSVISKKTKPDGSPLLGLEVHTEEQSHYFPAQLLVGAIHNNIGKLRIVLVNPETGHFTTHEFDTRKADIYRH